MLQRLCGVIKRQRPNTNRYGYSWLGGGVGLSGMAASCF
jgi:hypothetical protein